MLGFVIGIFYSNAAEWFVHKYILHGIGKKKGSYYSFHFHDHHKSVRKNAGFDPMYAKPIWDAPPKAKEAWGLVSSAILISPVLAISPGFVFANWLHSAGYYVVHKKAHLDPEWAREWLPWHYDHHMGPNQDMNWCVTYPLFDYVMGTRKPWLGTDEEIARRAAITANREPQEASG